MIKIVVDGKLLSAALSTVIGSAGTITGTDKPVVMLHAKGNRLTLRTTDLFLFSEAVIKLKEPASSVLILTVINPLWSMLEHCTGIVTLKIDKKEIEIRFGKSKAVLKTINSEAFPQFPVWDKGAVEFNKANQVIQAIKRVSFCASTAIVKPELYNVHLGYLDGAIIAEAADTHRYARISVPTKMKAKVDALIPLRAAVKLPSDVDETTEGRLYESFVGFGGLSNMVRWRIWARTSAGTYPTVSRFLPKKYSAKVVLAKDDVEQLFKTGAAFGDENYRNVLVTLKNGVVTGEASEQAVGSFQSTVKALGSKGGIKILVDAKHILDFLGSVKEKLVIKFTESLGPYCIESASDKEFFYLCWPLFLDKEKKDDSKESSKEE